MFVTQLQAIWNDETVCLSQSSTAILRMPFFFHSTNYENSIILSLGYRATEEGRNEMDKEI
jgi:hypothetical protein